MILLPVPEKIEEIEGEYQLELDSMIILDDSCPFETKVYADMLQAEIAESTGINVSVGRGVSRAGDIALEIDPNLSEDEYQIKIKEDGVKVSGGSKKAIGHGVQTLRQMFRMQGASIKNVNISDKPQFKARGYYHDATRGRIQKLSELKKLVDTMVFYKLNQLQLYVEHTYLFRDMSEVWRDDTPLTADEILELDDYCYQRDVELIPSIATFGHLYKVLRTRSYGELCELEGSYENKSPFSFVDRMNHHTLNVTDDNAVKFAIKIIDEFMSLFRTDKFNICADETFDLGKGKSSSRADEIGTGRMYVEFIKKLFEHLNEKGRTPMFWGDIISKYPELIKELPEDTICLTWGYSENESDRQTKTVAEAGGIQYVCPGCCGWNMWINYLHGSYENIRRMSSFGRQYGAIGLLNTDWGDYGHINHPVFSIPGLIYGAVMSWSDDSKQIEEKELDIQISKLEFLDIQGEFVSLLKRFDGTMLFSWNHAVYYKEWTQQHYPQKSIVEKLKEEDMSKVEEIAQKLDMLRKEARALARTMDSRNRYILECLEVSIKAIGCFNRVGKYLEDMWEEKETEKESRYVLATELEKILYHFKRIWRENSKEAALRDVEDIFVWYADLLRAGQK